MKRKLNMLYPNNVLIESKFDTEGEHFESWLCSMIEMNPLINFFYTVETTDIFEKEWNFNQIAGFEPLPSFVPPGAFVLDVLEQMTDRRRGELS